MAAQYSRYKVKKGDTLSGIALTLYRKASLWPEIAKANKLKAPYRLLVGMPLRIPLMPGMPSMTESANPAGNSQSTEVAYPTLNYTVDQEVFFPILNGVVKLKVSGELTLQKNGVFALNLGRQGIESMSAMFQTGGISASVDGKPFSAKDPQTLGILSEYGNRIASIFSNASLKYDPAIKRAELSFGIGWKFGNAQFEFVLPSTYRFSFPPQEVSSPGIKGKLAFVAEITTMQMAQPQPGPVTVPLNVRLAEMMPKVSQQDLVMVGGALAFAAAAVLIVEAAPIMLLALAL